MEWHSSTDVLETVPPRHFVFSVDGRILLTPVHSERGNLTRVGAIEVSNMNVGRGQIDWAEGVRRTWQFILLLPPTKNTAREFVVIS